VALLGFLIWDPGKEDQAVHLLVTRIVHLGRKSGWLFYTFYFKQEASSLMMAYGGDEFVHPMN